jgi:hypothetical protein
VGASGDASSSTGVIMTGKEDNEHRALLAQLSRVLSDRTNAAIADRIELRDAVCRYVEVEQARGMPLEGVVGTLKQILRNAEQGVGAATDKLAQQLVDWCVEFHHLGAMAIKKRPDPGN